MLTYNNNNSNHNNHNGGKQQDARFSPSSPTRVSNTSTNSDIRVLIHNNWSFTSTIQKMRASDDGRTTQPEDGVVFSSTTAAVAATVMSLNDEKAAREIGNWGGGVEGEADGNLQTWTL